MVKIKIKGIQASINNFKWECENKELEDLLNIITSDSTLNSLSIAEPDHAEAERIIEKFNGEIIEKIENPRWKRLPGRIY